VDDDRDAIPMSALICVQCGKPAEPRAEGWKAYLDDDDIAVLFCPDCTEREFGES
jgi:hypothetical protein